MPVGYADLIRFVGLTCLGTRSNKLLLTQALNPKFSQLPHLVSRICERLWDLLRLGAQTKPRLS